MHTSQLCNLANETQRFTEISDAYVVKPIQESTSYHRLSSVVVRLPQAAMFPRTPRGDIGKAERRDNVLVGDVGILLGPALGNMRRAASQSRRGLGAQRDVDRVCASR